MTNNKPYFLEPDRDWFGSVSCSSAWEFIVPEGNDFDEGDVAFIHSVNFDSLLDDLII